MCPNVHLSAQVICFMDLVWSGCFHWSQVAKLLVAVHGAERTARTVSPTSSLNRQSTGLLGGCHRYDAPPVQWQADWLCADPVHRPRWRHKSVVLFLLFEFIEVARDFWCLLVSSELKAASVIDLLLIGQFVEQVEVDNLSAPSIHVRRCPPSWKWTSGSSFHLEHSSSFDLPLEEYSEHSFPIQNINIPLWPFRLELDCNGL